MKLCVGARSVWREGDSGSWGTEYKWGAARSFRATAQLVSLDGHTLTIAALPEK